MGAGKLTLLPINSVELDRTNPRIRRFLEIHQGEPTYDQIALAVCTENPIRVYRMIESGSIATIGIGHMVA